MSFYIDPWLFNCASNPADSPERAGAAAHDHRGHAARGRLRARPRRDADRRRGQRVTDLGNPTSTTRARTSRRTRRTAHDRQRLPEHADRGAGRHRRLVGGPVNPASSPYPRKAYYSNYGVEQTDVAAPGGDSREFFGTPQYNAPENRILAAYPLNVAQACGEVDANGVPNGTTTATRLPGTSSPRSVPLVRNCAQRRVRAVPVDPGHVDGVAARGRRRGAHRRAVRAARPRPRRADARPDKVERILRARRPTRRARPGAVRVPEQPRGVRRDVRGHAGVQRVLRRRHRQRAGGVDVRRRRPPLAASRRPQFTPGAARPSRPRRRVPAPPDGARSARPTAHRGEGGTRARGRRRQVSSNQSG
jgi:hypothetical protein